MILFHVAVLSASFLIAASPQATDAKVAPGDNFFMAAQRSWYGKAQIPADQSSAGVGYEAFRVKADRYYLPPDQRIRIW